MLSHILKHAALRRFPGPRAGITVVLAVLSLAWLVGGPGELRGQDPRVITVQENAEHFLVTALREIVVERDSIAIEQLERAPIPSAGTLIAQGEGDVLLEMFWDEQSERRFRDVEPKPELAPLAESLASALRSWGIPTRTADTTGVSANLCEHVTVVEPTREQRGRGHTECTMPDGVSVVLRVSYPAFWGPREGDIAWVGVQIRVHSAQPDPRGGTHTGPVIVRFEPGSEGRPAWVVRDVMPGPIFIRSGLGSAIEGG